MEHIILYATLFVGLVVHIVDTVSDWLAAHGFSSGLVIVTIIGVIAFYVVDKWSKAMEMRLRAIESKLGIKHRPPVQNKSPWFHLLVWFLVAAYLLGKSLQAESVFAYAVGGVLSGFMLLVCAFCACCFIDQAVRNNWRKKRETQELIEKIYNKPDTS